MEVRLDDLTNPEVIALLETHLEDMYTVSPPGSMHALDIEALMRPEITFWSVWQGSTLMGCGALKTLDPHHAEIKSMRTAVSHQRKGVASHLLQFMLHHARARHYRRVSLETGAYDAFMPARKLYAKFGFTYCGPFADYEQAPTSVFMTLEL